MKKWMMLTLCLFLAGGFLLTQNASAYPYPEVDDTITFKAGYRGTNGGEFKVYYQDDANLDLNNYWFTTFCLEKGEYMNWHPNTFTIGGVNDYAVSGGGGAIWEDGEYRDYISDETRWLFWHYTVGDLDDYTQNGYSYTYNTNDGAGDLQRAIWLLENEISTIAAYSDGTYLVDMAGLAIADGDTDNIDKVKVLNLLNSSGGKAQDQLYAPAPVPEPATMLLLGAGLVGMAGYSRRKYHKKG